MLQYYEGDPIDNLCDFPTKSTEAVTVTNELVMLHKIDNNSIDDFYFYVT